MKSFFSALLLSILLLTNALVLPNTTFAQELPRIPDAILGNLTGYSTSYISGGAYGGSILVIGGVRNGTDYQAKALLYDPNNGELIEPEEGTLQLGARRAFHTATPLADGRILIFGGESSPNEYVSVAELFDPVSFAFVPVSVTGANLPNPERKNHAATFFYSLGSSKQYVLITGGCINACSRDSEVLRDSIIFDVEATAFMAGPLMNSPRQKHTATYLPTAASLGAVMQMGGNRSDAEYFDVETFSSTAGSGQFVQNESVRKIIADNQFLLKVALPSTQQAALNEEEVFSSIPGALQTLISGGKKETGPEKPAEDTDALRQQLAELNRLQQSINSLRVPGAAPRIIASDARGRVATSGGDATTTSSSASAQTASGTTMEPNVARALIEAQQERVASLLRGGALGTTWTGSGSIMNSIPTEATYGADFSLYLTSLDEKSASFLSSLTDFARDSDNDGLSDKAELSLGLHPFARDTNGDGVMDPDAFLGGVNQGKPAWAAFPYFFESCTEGTLWGRAKSNAEVGIFIQGEGAQRTQIAKTQADERGMFIVQLPADTAEGSVRLILRTSSEGGFVYSDIRQLMISACGSDEVVMIDRISVHEGRRQVIGRAKAGSLVLLQMQDALLATMATESGGFTMQLPASLSAGRTEIRAWQVHEGQTSQLQIYPLDIPITAQVAGQIDANVRSSAVENNESFWWIYTFGILIGTLTLCGLAFYTWRRYPSFVDDSTDTLQ